MSAGHRSDELAAVASVATGTLKIVTGTVREDRRQRERLKERIAEVRRWLGTALDDGRRIEAVFRQICDQMTPEERDLFFDAFLNSCGCALGAAHRRMRDAFVESVGAATRRPDWR